MFVSSPDDVGPERAELEAIVRRINDSEAESRNTLLRLFTWERNVVPQIGPSPQGVIDAQTPEFDIYIGIMSTRFGGSDTRDSGTEQEFRAALKRWSGSGSPWIAFYFNDAAPAARNSAAAKEYAKVWDFREELQKTGIVGSYEGLHGPRGFVEQVEGHLRKILQRLARPPANPPATTLGNSEAAAELPESVERLRNAANVDKSFDAQRVRRRVTVKRPDAHFLAEEWLRNVTADSCEELVRVVVSDAPTEFDLLKFSAEVTAGEQTKKTAITHVASADGRTFRIRIRFKGFVVEPGEAIRLRWNCVVPSSVARNADYWGFPHTWQRPVAEMMTEAAFVQDPADVHFYRSHADRWIPATLSGPEQETEPGGTPVFVYKATTAQSSEIGLFTWRLV